MKNIFVISAVSNNSGVNSDGIIVFVSDTLEGARINAKYVSSYESYALITEVGPNGVVNRWRVDLKRNVDLEKLEYA